jgi:uncharacterized protein (TIRG00374 family)
MKKSRNMVWTKLVRCLGIIFFLYLILTADFHTLYNRWEKISWLYIFPLPFISGLMLTLRAARWRLLLKTQGVCISPRATWVTYAMGVFWGMVTPGRLGDLTKAFYVHERTGFDWSRSLSSALVDRLLDIGFMGVAAIWAVTYLGFPNKIFAIILNSNFVFMSGLIFAIFLILITMMKAFRHAEKSWFLFASKLKIGMNDAKVMLKIEGWNCVLLTFLAYGLYFILTIFLAKSIKLPLMSFQVVAAIILVGIASYLPISIAGLGTREAMLLLVMNQLEIENGLELTLIFSSMFFVFCFVVPGSIGFICFWRQPMSFFDFRKEMRRKLYG